MKSRKSDKAKEKRYNEGGPWIMPREFSSKGVTTREVDDDNKEQVSLSKLEENIRLILYYLLDVVKYETQFALLPLSRTQNICNDKNITHPRDEKQDDRVMTTDLMLTVSINNGLVNIPISIKFSHAINKRTVEKFELERAYHKEDNLNWKLITEKQIDPILLINLHKLSEFYHQPDTFYEFVFEEFTLEKNRNISLEEFLSNTAKKHKVTIGDCTRNFYHLLARKRIRCNYQRANDSKSTLQEYQIVNHETAN